MKTTSLKTALKAPLLGLATAIATALPAVAVERPNIIIFYVDDLGWQDIEVNDVDAPCAYDTPHIKALAEEGMNFTQGYSPAPTCSPSRAAIICGQHPAQTGLTHVDLGSIKLGRKTENIVPPYLEAHLRLSELSLATALADNGYRTGHSGKWHAGLTAASFGFQVVDQDRGFHRGMNDRTTDFATVNDKKYPLSKEKYAPFTKEKPEGISYPYDQVTESALTFMKESGDEPFFLNLCHWMVHWPVLTRNKELLEYYCDKFDYDFPLEPGDMTRKGQQNPYFGAMVTSVDWSLGRVINFLKATDDPRNPGKKLFETTYIFFSSDNGGVEFHQDEIISDNAPLKYGKKHAEEGGVRVPLFVVGDGIPAGTTYNGLVNQLDFFPTILEMTGSTIADKDMAKLSGIDMTPVLTGKSDKMIDADGVERDNLWWHFPHNSVDSSKAAIRRGDYKLYKRFTDGSYELYALYKNGLRNDLEEMDDLAGLPEYAPIIKEMGDILEDHLAETHAQGAYLNPLFSGKETPSAAIKSVLFDASSRTAELKVSKAGPKLESAYVVYQPAPTAGGKKSRSSHATYDPRMKMKMPVELDSRGRMATATIPSDISAFLFLMIDANGYQTYSEITLAK